MIEHTQKVMHEKNGKHGMPYGFLLNRVFDHFKIVYEKGVATTFKKMFTMTTLI